MLNPKWLITFEKLAKNQSFTQTAKALFMTQPGVSQHIKKIENALGKAVIFREGKQFELTQAGLLLLDFIAKQQQQQQRFLQEIKEDNPYQGEIRIACSGSIAMRLYPHLLSYQQQYPEITVHLEAAPARQIPALLLDNHIDIGLSSQKIEHSTLITEKIAKEDLVLIMAKKECKPQIDFTFLCQLGFIDHPDGKHYADLVLGSNFAEDYRGISTLPIRGYVNQLAQILLPVSHQLGFTILPSSVLNQFAEKDKLIAIPLATSISQPLYLAQKRHRQLPTRYHSIIEMIKNLD